MNNQYYPNANISNLSDTGISAITLFQPFEVFTTINPFQFLYEIGKTKDALQNFIDLNKQFLKTELALRNSSEYNEFRNILSMVTDFPSLPVGTIDNRFTNDKKSLTIRQKLPLTPALWFPLHFIAFDQETRDALQYCLTDGFKIPKLLHELILRTRKSTCGNFIITPSLNTDAIDLFYIVAPELTNTFLDYKYLRTQQGIQSFLSFISTISHSDYTQFVESNIVKSIPIFSGFTTTQMSINTTESNPFAAHLMQGNSFSKGSPSEIHLLDAVLTAQKIFDTDGNPITISFTPTIQFEGLNIDTIANYIAKRCLSIKTNSLILDEDPIPELPPINKPKTNPKLPIFRKRKPLLKRLDRKQPKQDLDLKFLFQSILDVLKTFQSQQQPVPQS